MVYGQPTHTPSLLTLLVQGSVIATKPAMPYPLPQEHVLGVDAEPSVRQPSALASRPIVWQKVLPRVWS